ncbi:MAG: hypothetical protein RR701_07405 [Comamonas sp.]
MARNATPAPESKEVPANTEVIAAEVDATNQLAVIERNRHEIQTQAEQEKDEVFAAGVDLGRLEALDFVATVANSAILPIYENVKKSKAWKYLRNSKSGDGRHFESLDEFCEVKLGKSYKRLRELTLNRNLIGQEAFEQAERLGLRQVDYNAIKALPAPDQELVRRAVEEAQSRDEVLDLLQELAARHAKEKADLNQQLEESAKEHEATAKRLEVVTEQKEKAEAKAARIAVMKPDEALADLKTAATRIANDAVGAIQGGVRQALIKLRELPHGTSQTAFAAGLLGELQAEINALREEFGLPDIASAAERELAAETQAWAGGDNSDKA